MTIMLFRVLSHLGLHNSHKIAAQLLNKN